MNSLKYREFKAPGRVEIGGNHTDHQHGRVITAAVDIETRCVAKANGTSVIRIFSEQFGFIEVNAEAIEVHKSERGSASALVRGVAAWLHNMGHKIGGFDAEVSSDIPVGAGLSSSAAFEVLIGNVFKGLFQLDVSPLDIALAGQFAENLYFGKPCGLMDQAASSFGGLMTIDFELPQNPVVTPIQADISSYLMCVVDTGGSHAGLTDEYSAILSDMRSVSAHFGKEYLREVSADEFYSSVAKLRKLGDRALLRAIHFFDEHKRVAKQAQALKNGDIEAFLRLVKESGRSSLACLQNVYSTSSPCAQGITLALALSEKILGESGAWRVHGGGFAGTILAFVPDEAREEYSLRMCDVFGLGCCRFLNILWEGGMEVRDCG